MKGAIESKVAVTLVVLVSGLAAPAGAAASPAWLAPDALTNDELIAYTPVIAADSQGTAIAAWERSDGTHIRLETRVRPPGGSFGPAVPISPAGGSASEGSIAFDSHGNAIAVWSLDGRIEAALRPPGGSFEQPQAVSAEGEGAYSTQVAFDSRGNAVLGWIGRTGLPPNLTERVQVRERHGDGSYGPVQTLDTRSTTESSQMATMGPVRLAAASGEVLATWLSTFKEMAHPPTFVESSSYAIKAAIRPAGGSFSPALTLSSTEGTGPYVPRLGGPALAAGGQDEALVAWSRFEEEPGMESQRIQAKVRPAGGYFEAGAEEVSGAVKSAFLPQVALGPDGGAIAVWLGSVGGKPGVMEAERPPHGGFGAPKPISEPGVLSTNPMVAITRNDEAVVIWVRIEPPSEVEAAMRPAGGSFGEPQPISPKDAENHFAEPGLAVDGLGDAVAIWQHLETTYVAEAAAYDAGGPSLAAASIPDHGTVGIPLTFSAAPLDAWSPIASTNWAFGDGTTAGGADVTHTYSTPGIYTARVGSTDALGNASSASGTVKIRLAPPLIGQANQSHRRWREGGKLVHLSSWPRKGDPRLRKKQRHRVPVGTVFSFSLNENARVSFRFARRNTGRRAGRRALSAGTLAVTGRSGANKVAFQGRLSRSKRLRPGRYALTIAATNSEGVRSAPRRLSFTIVGR